eukprot:gnl/Trimastix_PCT/3751.p1 GENE.gnl/Trimastix_PCT/3751~~gnl/Trimastix_PCT/3751.p1  ORF type:complete len:293 (+),score=93.17 gnl/Trimastix_PCT/3751:22-900(+)
MSGRRRKQAQPPPEEPPPPPIEPIDTNVDFAQRALWLVKVPNFLHEAWMNSPGDKPIGKINMERNGDSPIPNVSIELDDRPEFADIPKQFNFRSKTGQPPTHVFSRRADGKLSIDGMVILNADAAPTFTDKYRFVRRNRVQAIVQQRALRTIREVEVDTNGHVRKTAAQAPRVKVLSESLPHKRPHSPPHRGKVQKLKRDRLPKEDVQDLIFHAFEQQSHWSLKGLLQKTDQPQAYLKEILSELCVYHKRGDHKAMYELKEMYRTETGPEEGGEGSGMDVEATTTTTTTESG